MLSQTSFYQHYFPTIFYNIKKIEAFKLFVSLCRLVQGV